MYQTKLEYLSNAVHSKLHVPNPTRVLIDSWIFKNYAPYQTWALEHSWSFTKLCTKQNLQVSKADHSKYHTPNQIQTPEHRWSFKISLTKLNLRTWAQLIIPKILHQTKLEHLSKPIVQNITYHITFEHLSTADHSVSQLLTFFYYEIGWSCKRPSPDQNFDLVKRGGLHMYFLWDTQEFRTTSFYCWHLYVRLKVLYSKF